MKIKKIPNIQSMFKLYKHKFDLLQFLEAMIKSYGQDLEFKFGTMRGFVLNDPKLVKHVLVDSWQNFPKSRRYKTFSPLIGDSILVANGESWVHKRKLAQPIFQPRYINQFTGVIMQSVNELIFNLCKNEESKAFEAVSLHTFNIISKITFGNSIEGIFKEFHHSVIKLQKLCIKKALAPFPFMDHLPLPVNLKFNKESAKVHKQIDHYIKERLNDPNQNHSDLLQRYLTAIIDSKDKLSMEELRNELVTMIIAGNETSALTMFWCLVELMKAPNELNNLEVEIKNIIDSASSNEELHEKILNSKIIDNIILETLRMYPAVWAVTREALENEVFDENLKFKKDDIILISPYFVHRNPNVWEKPDSFIPSRFNLSYNDDAFIPFAKGPRFCIGKSLALLEIKLTLFYLFKEFSITSKNANIVKPKGLINLYPSTELLINCIKK